MTGKSENDGVQNFLDGIMLTDAEKYDCVLEMREMVFNTYPDVSERIMYGGIMFSLHSEDFSGLFVRKNHVSFEFSEGHQMKDPHKLLEGTGTSRRHLKIRTREDLEKKQVLFFVRQALGARS